MLASKLLSPIGNTDKLYVDDVFSAYTYTGNGSTQTINNGIDLAGKGGLVWIKDRKSSDSGSINLLFDTTASSPNLYLVSNTTSGRAGGSNNFQSFNANGFTLGNDFPNWSGRSLISWTFRKAPKFFDIVTYTGNGVAGRQIPHALGVAPGMIVIKRTNAASGWRVWHRSLSPNAELRLDDTAYAYTPTPVNFSSAPTETNITTNGDINILGASYVAYLFAHDTTADGIVQCGSFTGVPSSVTLGWEPQYLLIKRTDAESDWWVYDTARNWHNGGAAGTGTDSRLRPNLANAEQTNDDFGEPTATGFNFRNESSGTYIYLAIRRPNKPPTTGTQVFSPVTTSALGFYSTGFAVDAVITVYRSSPVFYMGDRLRGGGVLLTTQTTLAESTYKGWQFDSNTGVIQMQDPRSSINLNFRRAPGFFDVVCPQSTASADLSFSHGLGVVPELIIHKDRGNGSDWDVWTTALGGKYYLKLNTTNAAISVGQPSTLTATSVFSGSGSQTSNSPQVCYLFATLPGISKVGSYTGNGSSQTINCGFSTGARFILIKRTDSAGDWYVWDTARGIVSANDPHLSLNTTAAEVTSNDSVDPDATGFIVNQVTATNINVTGATYLYLAIA